MTFALVFFLALASCTTKENWGFFEGSQGEEIRWKPAAPQIGDLVEVEVFVPGQPGQTGGESVWRMQDSNGTGEIPLSIRYTPGGVKLGWAFRIERPGDWFFTSLSEKSEAPVLWTVVTIAGDENTLKEIDAEAAWIGVAR